MKNLFLIVTLFASSLTFADSSSCFSIDQEVQLGIRNTSGDEKSIELRTVIDVPAVYAELTTGEYLTDQNINEEMNYYFKTQANLKLVKTEKVDSLILVIEGINPQNQLEQIYSKAIICSGDAHY